jgi:hypothetical protein
MCLSVCYATSFLFWLDKLMLKQTNDPDHALESGLIIIMVYHFLIYNKIIQ